MRGTFEPATLDNFLDLEITPDTAKLEFQKLVNLAQGGKAKIKHFPKAPPDRTVQHPVVVRGCQNQATPFVGIQHLKYGVDHAPQFAMLGNIFAFIGQGVELIKEHDRICMGGELKHFTKVSGCLA